MKLIIKDYLLQLKEKDELDLLICDLLFQMGYVTENKPKTGNRQYGVDVAARNEQEALLCVVKQGNLNRRNWDDNQNSVRQSLNEINDSYIDMMYRDKLPDRLRIAVISNGEIDEAVRPSWNGYVSQNRVWHGIETEIEFWNIDQITNLVNEYLFDEYVFSAQNKSMLRKALYFVGESDYKREYYEEIIDDNIFKLRSIKKTKEYNKVISSLFLVSQMISQYAAEKSIYKIGIQVTQYLIIKYWKFLFLSNSFEDKTLVLWLYKFLAAYEKWNYKYYEAVKICCESKYGFPQYTSPVEQRIVIYEVLSRLTSFAYYLSCKCDNVGKYKKSFLIKNKIDDYELNEKIIDSILNMINNNRTALYAPFDKHICVIGMFYRLLDKNYKSQEWLLSFMNEQCICLAENFIYNKQYPTSDDSYEDALNIYMSLPAMPYKTSAFWGTMLEWIILFNQKNLYNELMPFFKDNMKNTTKCIWMLDSSEEKFIYDYDAMYKSGEGIVINISDSYDIIEKDINLILSNYKDELFSYEKYGFEALEFIICDYYGYLPRVKREE